jgi:hypothetical protein
MTTSVSNSNGVLTVQFAAPSGIPANGPGDFNFLGIVFQNISNDNLEWDLGGSSPNVFQNLAAETFTGESGVLRNFGLGGKAEGFHFSDVLSFHDEFREDIG